MRENIPLFQNLAHGIIYTTFWPRFRVPFYPSPAIFNLSTICHFSPAIVLVNCAKFTSGFLCGAIMISHVALVLSCHSKANNSDCVIKWSARSIWPCPLLSLPTMAPAWCRSSWGARFFCSIEFLSSSDARLFKLSWVSVSGGGLELDEVLRLGSSLPGSAGSAPSAISWKESASHGVPILLRYTASVYWIYIR